ncbi:acetate/propionate family kinase [Francisella orientalis]|uniref:Acetate kinase n=2 Tax=Francisella orientalis TaxID=299583 RepID=A0AAP7KJT2_9GAMM|nr:acetate kinase [Francisella orientalis]AFJ42666.1 propionate kinase 2 / acetate kinase A [Francisella orientalis str. Toba 04]AHB97816.1 acetate kinase [Francisella orientalis LADL 07-285A]AKN84910.1 Acetate kinase [Francisella orientalis FNO12]AKN86448.1 Acetate kinase [Francisella orientalis FNO24]AKN87986.1 Acetate kinase [Francisella orientalis]
MSYILVLNCGSSSVKFALMNPKTSKSLVTGLAENIGASNCKVTFKTQQKVHKHIENGEYKDIFELLKDFLVENNYLEKISAIGHRVVHGGQYFSKSVIIDKDSLQKIKDCIPLAPLHNPAHIEGMLFCQQIFPNLPQVAVFDTAFHQTMPEYVAEYAIPRELTCEHNIRKYGAHGTSHKYVSQQAAKILNKDVANVILAHLGNGCSITAVVNGKSIDTSMGLTPLDGLVMGTRSGCIDPSVFAYISDNLGWNIADITNMLNKKSGLLGICGHSDMREVSELADNGNKLAKLAIEIFCHRIAKFVGSYMIYFKEFDGLVFTGGIGENATNIRKSLVSKLANIGFEIDDAKNMKSETFINVENSHNIMVIATNEELMIAQETQNLI